MKEKLKQIRIENQKTQKQIAIELNISRSTYNNYEQGVAEPDINTLKKIADIYHTTTDNLLNHEVPYLLDKSTLTEEQREIIEIVPEMNCEECKLMLAYLAGIRKGIEERNKIFNLKNKEIKNNGEM